MKKTRCINASNPELSQKWFGKLSVENLASVSDSKLESSAESMALNGLEVFGFST